jgi:hypothetical protein
LAILKYEPPASNTININMGICFLKLNNERLHCPHTKLADQRCLVFYSSQFGVHNLIKLESSFSRRP